MIDAGEWDTIIVGAGSAGCAIAARLSADGARRVLLLEAGPSDLNMMLRVPFGALGVIGNKRYDWCYSTEPDPNMAGRRLSWPRGKVLGGSSAINGLLAIRGQAEDYDGWRDAGCQGWGWKDVLPYFIRLEDYEGGGDNHGVDGPLPLSKARGVHPISDVYRETVEKLGIPPNSDFNGATQFGAGYHRVNISRGLIPVRVSAAGAYLKKARKNRNLRIITGALVHRVTFAGKRANGVVFSVGEKMQRAAALREVVLSGGTISSPHLLQLSGIGCGEHLSSLGIDVVHHLPAVGQNLQDHLQTSSVYRLNVPTFNAKLYGTFLRGMVALEGIFVRTGAYYGVSHFGFFAITEGTRPDVQFHVHPASGSLTHIDRFWGLSIAGCHLQPESRGKVVAKSPDPREPPAIFANYLATEKDRRVTVATLKLARKLSKMEPLRNYIVEERRPGPIETDDEFLDYARRTGETTYHPVGTCRMGSDDASVVDPQLRVRGVAGLYVADASIMPTLISGNTHVPAVMIGEKASDLILENSRV
jgi:choline dehydrogenase